MRSWLVVVVAVGLMAAFLGPAVGQDLLEEPVYTVHFDDPLEDVIKQLREEHDIHIEADAALRSTRVVLYLEDATEVELLDAICPQVGAVYNRYGEFICGRWWWLLRPGDWDDDPRPQAHVQDYAVYVETVSAWRVFTWGGQNPAEEEGGAVATYVRIGGPVGHGGYVRSVTLGLSVFGKTNYADMVLGALRLTEAECDIGETWTADDEKWDSWHAMDRFGHAKVRIVRGLPEGARRVARLRGVLGLFSAVELGAVTFRADEVDVTKSMASSEVTLVEWKVEDEKVNVKVKIPRPERGSGSSPLLEAALLDAAGESVGRLRRGGYGGRGDMRYMSLKFEDVVDQAVALRLHGYVQVGPLTEVPFEIEDIPLP